MNVDDERNPAESSHTEVRGPIRRVFDAWTANYDTMMRNVDVVVTGFRHVTTLPQLYKVLNEVVGTEQFFDIEQARRSAADATKEVAAGFPTVHGQSLMATWGAFESFIDDLCLAMLEVYPGLFGSQEFARVKVPVATLSSEASLGGFSDQVRQAVMFEAMQKLGSDLAVGVNRFEGRLSLVGLGGPVPRQIKDALFEAQQVRNVWAHRAGIADSRFLERCPSLGATRGALVSLDDSRFTTLVNGMEAYSVLLAHRVSSRLIAAPPPREVVSVGMFKDVLEGVDFRAGTTFDFSRSGK